MSLRDGEHPDRSHHDRSGSHAVPAGARGGAPRRPSVEVVRPHELTEARLEAWRALQRQGRHRGRPQWGSPFLAPEFSLAVGEVREDALVAVLGPRDAGEGSAAGTPDGFLPFQRGRWGVGRAMGLGLSDCQGAVCRTDLHLDPAELLRSCGLAVWEFDHLADGQALARGDATRVTSSHASPIIEVRHGYQAYLAGLRETAPKFTRTTLAKERRMGRDLGPLRYVHDERDPRALRTLLAWKSAQYRRTGRGDRFAREWIVTLIERLFDTHSPSFGGLLSVLYAGERPVAAHFGLRSDHTLACWFPAYDPAFAKYSPGLVLHLRMAEGTADAGLSLLDLGRGAKEYKDSLKTGELTVHEGYVTRRHPVALGHRAHRAPVRALREAVVSRPRLFGPADRMLKRWGTITGDMRRKEKNHVNRDL